MFLYGKFRNFKLIMRNMKNNNYVSKDSFNENICNKSEFIVDSNRKIKIKNIVC